MFSGVYSHFSQIDFLLRLHKKNRIPSSMIFSGTEGIGKLLVARNFVRYVFCKGDKSNSCKCIPCKKVLNNTAVDFHEIWPEEGLIKLDVIREIKKESEFEPFESELKIYILNDAHCLNMEASNAFLKMLEEPKSSTHFILITSEEQRIIETIRSRSMSINFSPLSVADVVTCLTSRGFSDENSASLAARLSGGSVGKAINLATVLKKGLSRLKDMISVLTSESKSRQLSFLQDNEQEIGFDLLLFNFMVVIVDALSVLEGSTRCLISKGLESDIMEISRRFSKAELLNLFWLIMSASKSLKNSDDYYPVFLDLFWNFRRRIRSLS